MKISLLAMLLLAHVIPTLPFTFTFSPNPANTAARRLPSPLLMSDPGDFPSDTSFEPDPSPVPDAVIIDDPSTSARDELLSACKSPGSLGRAQLESLVSSLPPSPAPAPETSKWSLLEATTDRTRSSPFFASFTEAIGLDKSSQIYSITDSIPSPLKEIGSATQTFDSGSGTLVSRVVVSTLGGASSSVMTSRCSYTPEAGGVSIKVLTTKPEDSTVLSLLPGALRGLAEAVPAFPSGEALRVANGGEDVVVASREVYVDEVLRVNEMAGEVFVWERVFD